jgi:hypothetical protein
VRIRVKGEKSVFASGTIIKSTPDESIILTSSSIIPRGFLEILVGPRAAEDVSGGLAQDPSIQTLGEVVDVDRARGVALIRFRPGRTLPASPIAPRNWKPSAGSPMTAIQGYSAGSIGILAQCWIIGLVKGQGDRDDYQAIECNLLPKQDSTGSGLFTSGPYGQGNLLAGVCNFSDAARKTGLYASPAMIYPILEKNGLSSLDHAEDPNLSIAPQLDFPIERVAPSARDSEPEGQGPTPLRVEAFEEVRLRAVERRVDAVDGKLDEILNLLKNPR